MSEAPISSSDEAGDDPFYERLEPSEAKKNELSWVPYAMIAGGIFLLFMDDVGARIAGVGLLAFGGWVIVNGVRNEARAAVTITRAGLLMPVGTAFGPVGLAPWDDIESVAVVKGPHGVKFVGVRLRSYDRFVASLDPDEAAALVRGERLMSKIAAPVAIFATLQGQPGDGAELADASASTWSADSVQSVLAANRKVSNADILLTDDVFDRRPEELVAYLEVKRHAILADARYRAIWKSYKAAVSDREQHPARAAVKPGNVSGRPATGRIGKSG